MSRAQTLAKARAQSRKRLNAKAPPRTGLFLTGKNLKTVPCILLGAATIALYSPVIGHLFVVFDDHDYVTGNPYIHGGVAWSTIKWAFTSTYASNWHPLTWLSHALDYQLFGLSPAGHHLDSLLIHVVNAVLLFLVLQWITKRVGPSLLVAALFALHPINVESVAWVAERKNVLSTLFFLLAIAAYVWYAQKPDWRRYVLVGALFTAGLMAKPMVITLPFVLLLLDYWPLDRTPLNRTPLDGSETGPALAKGVLRVGFSTLVLEKVPLLVLSAASGWITLKAQRTGHAVRTLQQSPLAVRIENAIVSYGLYLWKMVWPGRLAALYPYPENRLPAWQVTLSALMLLVVTALVWVLRRKRYLPVGWFWFLGTLIPVIGVARVGAAAMADRYAYVPLIGIFLMIAWGLDDWAEAKAVRAVWRVIPALCVLTALGVATSRQLSYWDNDYDLWSQALAVNEQNPFAHDALALFLVEPGVDAILNQRANLDTKQKLMVEARRHFERAVELRRQLTQQNPAYLPDLALALRNLANLDLLENRMDEARQHYEEALKIDRQLAQQNPDPYLPDMAGMLMNLGSLERSQKQLDKADLHFEEALKIDRQLAQQGPDMYLPDMANRLINLGNFDTEQNRMDEARPHYEEALKIDRQLAQRAPDMYQPDVAGTLNNLAILDESQNRIEEARAHYQESLTIFQKLAQADPARYAGDLARVEASLEKLDRKGRSQ